MFVFNHVTGEMEWLPRSMCFADTAAADDDAGDAGDGGDGDAGGEPDPKPEAKPDATDWRDGIDDPDLRKQAERFNSPADAVRAIADLRKRDSQVRVPGKDADEKAIAAYHKAIGVPEEISGYEFPALPEGEELTDDLKAFREGWATTFKELGIPKAAGETLAAKFQEEQVAAQEALVAADKRYAEEQTDALNKEWGADYEKNDALANRAVAAVASKAGVSMDDLKQIEMKDGRFLLDRADMKRLFAGIGREMEEGSLRGDLDDDTRDNLDSQIEDAQRAIDEAQAKGDHRKADQLYQKKMGLIAKRDGNRSAA